MHILAHVLDPMTCAATGAISMAAVSYAAYRVKEERVKQESVGGKLPLMMLAGVSILAAQAFNFPIATGSSGHFLGGALAGILLGPWAGMLVMAAVIAIQCLLFHDGGLSALGTNVLNMAVVGSVVGHFVYAEMKVRVSGQWGLVLAAAVAAWVSVMASASVCAVELSVGGGFPLLPMAASMLSIHGVIAVGEVVITGVAVVLMLEAAPKCTWRSVAIGLTCVAVAAFMLSPFVSRLPDGLESCLSQAAVWSRS